MPQHAHQPYLRTIVSHVAITPGGRGRASPACCSPTSPCHTSLPRHTRVASSGLRPVHPVDASPTMAHCHAFLQPHASSAPSCLLPAQPWCITQTEPLPCLSTSAPPRRFRPFPNGAPTWFIARMGPPATPLYLSMLTLLLPASYWCTLLVCSPGMTYATPPYIDMPTPPSSVF